MWLASALPDTVSGAQAHGDYLTRSAWRGYRVLVLGAPPGRKNLLFRFVLSLPGIRTTGLHPQPRSCHYSDAVPGSAASSPTAGPRRIEGVSTARLKPPVASTRSQTLHSENRASTLASVVSVSVIGQQTNRTGREASARGRAIPGASGGAPLRGRLGIPARPSASPCGRFRIGPPTDTPRAINDMRVRQHAGRQIRTYLCPPSRACPLSQLRAADACEADDG